MTVLKLKPGICGFDTVIHASRLSGDLVCIHLETQCESVQKFAQKIKSIEWKVALTSIDKSVIYTEAAKSIKHASCPVPFSVVKAIEVEIGVALPKNVSLKFE